MLSTWKLRNIDRAPFTLSDGTINVGTYTVGAP
jgi:hypothetical protein